VIEGGPVLVQLAQEVQSLPLTTFTLEGVHINGDSDSALS
jgi:hypothetical protein